MSCPLCKSDAHKVIYFGLPMRLCADDNCNCLFGFWSTLANWLPIASEDERGEPAFAFMSYEGSYVAALWAWLTDVPDGGEA